MTGPDAQDVLYAEIDRLKAELAKRDETIRRLTPVECRRCGEVEPCGEYGMCAACVARLRLQHPEARL